MTQVIRILVADDHPVVRKGIGAMLDPRPDLELVGTASNGEEAVEQARALKPDVILMDLVMPLKGGIEAIKEIKEDNPDARILVLTSFEDDETIIPAIKAGAMGYVLKVSSPQELLQAIRDVYHGGLPLDPQIARKLITGLTQAQTETSPEDILTEREIDVLKLIAKGWSNLEIANELNISEGTVRFHTTHILDKLNLRNRTQAALYALRSGLATL